MKLSRVYYIIPLLIYLSFFINSCTEEIPNPSEQPKVLKFSELMNPTGFGYKWFPPNYNEYQPDTNIVKQIADAFAKNPCRFYIYVNPSCACNATQKQFPSIVKSLTSANIDASKFEMYSMNSTDDNNPYSKILKVMRLPSCFIIRGGAAVYSVTDTLTFYEEDKNYLIEEVILIGLKK